MSSGAPGSNAWVHPASQDFAVSSPKVRAILDSFQPGELGGDAILNLQVDTPPGTTSRSLS